MKRLFLSALILTLAFSGCGKEPAIAATNKNEPASPPVDPRAVPTSQVAFSPDTGDLVSPQDVPLLEQINQENTRVVAAALPSVVRIVATSPVDPRMELFGREMPFGLPFGPGQHHLPRPTDTAYGSGVIITKDGYVLTNNHVIEEAKDIQVQLGDKRTFPARVVAADDMVDIAVLKIDATDLAALPWGDSDKVQVGEQVFAIGNPFDLDDSVSKGIVSAKGRSLPDSNNYEDYIQTDAAINPGNSGGPLINIYGQLIGINAAIATNSQVNMGVGFAIPSNLARYAVEGLLKEGKLVRGYLGVVLPVSVDEGVMGQLGLKSDQGALLAGILPGSPAEKAGLHSGDFITSIDDHKIDSIASLRLVVAQIPIGKEVTLNYVRNGVAQSVKLNITEVPQGIQTASSADGTGDQFPPSPDTTQPAPDNVLSGLKVSELNDKTRQKYDVDQSVNSGVVITGVEQDSVAEAKGLATGEVIESACVNRGSTQEIAKTADYANFSKNLKPDQSVVLLVHSGKTSRFTYLSPEK